MKKVDLVGKVFGRLTVVEKAGNLGIKTAWLCRCECGTTKVVRTYHLIRNAVVSCGCYRVQVIGDRVRTHGMTGTPEYRSWYHMLDRCNNPSDFDYPNYGGRGIKVCPEWHSFENFYADMGARPEGLTLERVDNERGYSPDNCVWADRYQQSGNARPVYNSTTGVVGVWKKGNRFKAYIKEQGTKKYLGSASTVDAASALHTQALEEIRSRR